MGTGTSSGVPMIACQCPVCHSSNKRDIRLRSSILVQSEKTTLVVDAGPDFRYQMLRAHVNDLQAILFTHPHKDHVAGLDDVRAFNYFSGEAMQVYSNEMTQEVLLREFPYAFTEHRYPGVPEIKLNTITTSPFMIGDIPVQPIEVWHLKMPVLGFRFGDFVYITDANRIDSKQQQKIKNCKVLVLNALRKEPHISHFTMEESVSIATELEVPQTYLTHISHQLGLHDLVSAELPPHVALAYDELQFRVG